MVWGYGHASIPTSPLQVTCLFCFFCCRFCLPCIFSALILSVCAVGSCVPVCVWGAGPALGIGKQSGPIGRHLLEGVLNWLQWKKTLVILANFPDSRRRLPNYNPVSRTVSNQSFLPLNSWFYSGVNIVGEVTRHSSSSLRGKTARSELLAAKTSSGHSSSSTASSIFCVMM